ncbi:MAG TPA: amino acid permease, partial [Thermoplasmata archaeon]|nr:amino acid permease [Thermoplasmata archaeon]
MAEPSPSEAIRVKVTRDLGLRDVVVLGLTAMVGAGVFVLSGTIARVAGVAAVLGIGMAAFVVLLNSLAYSELAGARPDAAGGGYGWVRGTLPAPSGFLSGWLSWAGHLTAAALSAAGIGLLADFLLDTVLNVPGFPVVVPLGGGTYNVTEKAIAVVVYLAFVLAGARRTSTPGRRISWLGVVKLSLIVVFVGVAAAALLTVP